jgi:NAD(P)-dependent dehydrogenase (short-subunit alcohol dehydrogenase family)
VAEGFVDLRVVVTGAAGGFGSELCRSFLREGARVVAVDLDSEGLARLGSGVEAVRLDLTDREAVEAHDFGPVDVLVDNAGVTALGAFSEIDGAGFDRVIDVNVNGTANITRHVLPSLIERSGRIAVLSSVAGFAPLVHRTAYAASKHALHGLFGSLRVELESVGVGVTLICPTFADTGIETRAVARANGITGQWSTTGRHLSATQVAEHVVRGLERRKRLVLPGMTAKLAYLVWSIAPTLYERLMRRRISASTPDRPRA